MTLLDTHIMVWAAFAPAKLSRAARRAVEAAWSDEGLACASVSVLELAQLFHRGKVKTRLPVREAVEKVLLGLNVAPLELTAAIAAQAVAISGEYVGDPVDQVIAATALVERIPLVTADERLRSIPSLRCVW